MDGDGKETMDWYHSSRFSIPVKIFHHDNFEHRGRSATRNLGIEHAEGKYSVFLDSDMEADPEMLVEHLGMLGEGKNLVGVDIGASSIKVVQLKESRKRLQVVRFGFAPLRLNPPRMRSPPFC